MHKIILLVLMGTLFQCKMSSSSQKKQQETPLSPEIISSIQWESKYTVDFDKMGNFKFLNERYGCSCVKGSYEIFDKSKVRLYALTKCSECENLTFTKPMICEANQTPNDIHYEEAFECHNSDKEKVTLLNPDKRVVPSALKNWEGVQVMTILKPGVATTTVNLRTKPSIDAPLGDYYNEADEITRHVLLKDHRVTVLARTIEKHTVKEWQDYWYYVKVEGDFNMGEAWVFGKFISIYE